MSKRRFPSFKKYIEEELIAEGVRISKASWFDTQKLKLQKKLGLKSEWAMVGYDPMEEDPEFRSKIERNRLRDKVRQKDPKTIKELSKKHGLDKWKFPGTLLMITVPSTTSPDFTALRVLS